MLQLPAEVNDLLGTLERAGIVARGRTYFWSTRTHITPPYSPVYVTTPPYDEQAVDFVAWRATHCDSARRKWGAFIPLVLAIRTSPN